MYVTQLLRNIFKRSKEKGCAGSCNTIVQIIYWPLVKIREYTIPMSDEENWSRVRASVLPSTQLLGFFYCFGMLNDLSSDPGDDDYEAAM